MRAMEGPGFFVFWTSQTQLPAFAVTETLWLGLEFILTLGTGVEKRC